MSSYLGRVFKRHVTRPAKRKAKKAYRANVVKPVKRTAKRGKKKVTGGRTFKGYAKSLDRPTTHVHIKRGKDGTPTGRVVTVEGHYRNGKYVRKHTRKV